jgi:peptide-methionine (S)-S-oxide reductase
LDWGTTKGPWYVSCQHGSSSKVCYTPAMIRTPTPEKSLPSTIDTIVLGGGCFWCTEAVFQRVKGVISVVPGYAGGKTPQPTYHQVSTGVTGHAEVIKVEFDQSIIDLQTILTIFMVTHDPTTLNRQGADSGTMYRSIILTNSDDQTDVARALIADMESQQLFPDPIVTEVQALTGFTEAEAEHHDYYNRHMTQGYCSVVIAPKLGKLRSRFAEYLA